MSSSGAGDTSSLRERSVMENPNEIEWKPITLTFVEYPKGDILGYLLAWISLSPLVISAGFLALIIFRRDLHTITFFIGIVLNEMINKVLKHWIQEPRPMERLPKYLYSEYGMPSSHSQFVWFFATYVTLFILIRLHQLNNNSPWERAARIFVLFSSWTLAVTVCFSRIYLLYHTLNQVIVGILIGILTGGFWFALVHVILTPFFPYIVSWKISEMLLLRDTTLIPNILWFEYTVTRQEARARTRKLISMKSQ